MFPRFSSIVLASLSLVLAAPVLAQGANGLSFQHISIGLTTDSLARNQASLNFDVTNSLSTATTIKRIAADLGILGLPLVASFNHSFSNLVVPAQGTANSGTIENITFNLGLLSIIEVILLPTLDIINGEVTTSIGQAAVPANFTLNLV